MIRLTELIHSLDDKKNEGLVNIDDWRWPDVDHLVTMGFEFADDYRLTTGKEPLLTVYKKKDKDTSGKESEYFFVEESERGIKRFAKFNEIIDYFDHYEQPEIDKNS